MLFYFKKEDGNVVANVLIALLLIACLIGVSFLAFKNHSDTQKEAIVKSDLKNIATMMEGQYATNRSIEINNYIEKASSKITIVKESKEEHYFCLKGEYEGEFVYYYDSTRNGLTTKNACAEVE